MTQQSMDTTSVPPGPVLTIGNWVRPEVRTPKSSQSIRINVEGFEFPGFGLEAPEGEEIEELVEEEESDYDDDEWSSSSSVVALYQ